MGCKKIGGRISPTHTIPVLLMGDISNTLMTRKAAEYLKARMEKVHVISTIPNTIKI